MSNSELRLVTIKPDQLRSLYTLWNESAIYDPISEEVLAEKIFADDRVLPELRVAAFRPDDELAGFAVAAVSGTSGFVKLIAVRPSAQLEGIGSQLLDHVEATCRSCGAQTIRFAESAPNYLTPGLDAKNEPALAFLKRRGYSSIGQAYNQTVQLLTDEWSTSDEEQQLASIGYNCHRATDDDRSSIGELLVNEWPSWQAEVDCALANTPATLHIAKLDEKVVAFSAYDANNIGTGWFGPMGTASDHNGKGLGRVLLRRCLADLREQGHFEATIPWVGPLGFYEKHAGAKLSREFVRLEKSSASSFGTTWLDRVKE